jgi:5-methylcytosine-specific restriction endonuclease McrA
MPRRTWTEEDLRKVVPLANSVSDVLKRLGLCVTGSNPQTIRSYILRLSLDTTHFVQGGQVLGPLSNRKSLTEKDILSLGSHVRSSKVAKYIRDNNLLPYQCSECGVVGSYNGKPLTLQLDHRNGIRDDNRPHNLRWLCPNCHSQTGNFAGRAVRNRGLVVACCLQCGREFQTRKKARGSLLSNYCSTPCRLKGSKHSEKGKWPGLGELKKMVWAVPVTEAAKLIGVSGRAVKKRCARLGIVTPPRGHWARVQSCSAS